MNIEDKLKKLNDEKLLISADIFKLNKTLDIELKNQSMSLSLQISIISSLDDSYKKVFLFNISRFIKILIHSIWI